MKICDELTDGDELVEHLVGDGVEELVDPPLLLRALDLVIVEDGKHLVGGAAKHVRRLAAELPLDDAEQGLVGGSRLLGPGPVHDVVDEREHADLALRGTGGGGAAPALGVEAVADVVVRGVARLPPARQLDGGLGLDGAVAEAPRVDPAPERLGLAGVLVRSATGARAGAGAEHEVRVLDVVVLPRTRVRLGATAATRLGHGCRSKSIKSQKKPNRIESPRGRDGGDRFLAESMDRLVDYLWQGEPNEAGDLSPSCPPPPPPRRVAAILLSSHRTSRRRREEGGLVWREDGVATRADFAGIFFFSSLFLRVFILWGRQVGLMDEPTLETCTTVKGSPRNLRPTRPIYFDGFADVKFSS